MAFVNAEIVAYAENYSIMPFDWTIWVATDRTSFQLVVTDLWKADFPTIMRSQLPVDPMALADVDDNDPNSLAERIVSGLVAGLDAHPPQSAERAKLVAGVTDWLVTAQRAESTRGHP
jgi:hypothetical protein